MVVLFRRRCEAMKDFSIPLPGPLNSGARSSYAPSTLTQTSNLACFLWAFVAFLFGVMVGVTLPLLLAKYTVDNMSATTELSKDLSQLHPKWGTLSLPPTVPYKEEVTSASPYAWPMPISQSVQEEGLQIDSDKDDKEFIPTTGTTKDEAKDVSGTSILEDNVFFGSAVEAAMPDGFSNDDVDEWRNFIRREAVVRLQEGCGRMQNRLLTFSNGTQSCCRYRQNLDQIQGEIFSFYLSRLLGINNVPPSALGVVKAGAWQWSGIGNQLALAQWAEERPVVLTKFVEGLQQVSIPQQLRSSSRRLHPLDVERLSTEGLDTLVELAQWSDLLVFDYLTANLDRVVNNLYNLQWNPSMMEAPAHNLAQKQDSKLLVFLDNESGLLHGYRLLDKYEPFHASLLQSLCVFRRSTADRIRQLVSKKEVGPKLFKMFRSFEPDLQDYLPSIPEKSIKVLNERLKRVHKQIKKCENLYMNS